MLRNSNNVTKIIGYKNNRLADGLQESDITFTLGQYACLSTTYIGK